MTRDYKSADRRKKSRRKKNRRKSDVTQAPSWAWLLVGLGLGLSVAWFVNLKKDGEIATVQTKTQDPSSDPGEPVVKTEQPDTRFDFYEMLPEFEVIIPEKEPDVRRDVKDQKVTDAGSYILQTGSFQNMKDADRMKARLALLGLESRIQRVSIDSQTWHRVRIGPVENLNTLNEFRRRLWEHRVQFIVVRSPE